MGFYGLENLSDDKDIGVIIVVERAVGGDAGVYQKSSLPYLDPVGNYEEEEREGEGRGINKEGEEECK